MTKSPDQAGKLLIALNIEEAGKDLREAARYLLTMPEVQPKKVGALGPCMGGQLALYAATEFPSEISAAVDFYRHSPKSIHLTGKAEGAGSGTFRETGQIGSQNAGPRISQRAKIGGEIDRGIFL